MKLYQRIAQAMDAHARVNDDKSQFAGDPRWHTAHRDAADALVEKFLPRGSGIDNGVKIDWDRADRPCDQFHLIVEYHNMDENGFYDGWGTYKVVISANLAFEFDLRITGGQRKYAATDKDYLGDLISDALNEEVTDEQWKEVIAP